MKKGILTKLEDVRLRLSICLTALQQVNQALEDGDIKRLNQDCIYRIEEGIDRVGSVYLKIEKEWINGQNS